MEKDNAAPCRHAGVAPQSVIDSVMQLIQEMGSEPEVLNRHGLTQEEFETALPSAIEALRGSMSASVSDRKHFLFNLFQTMVDLGHLTSVTRPKYGEHTVYRLAIEGFGDVAVIQKGCPDGAHSSVAWTAPAWAEETYLWWLCDSMRYEPGTHIFKGVDRLRAGFLGDRPDTVSGVIFHNHLCGSSRRPCPKQTKTLKIGTLDVPPPCVYTMPDRDPDATAWNWAGDVERVFPRVLLAAFGIAPEQVPQFTGQVGFQQGQRAPMTKITSRSGVGRMTTARS